MILKSRAAYGYLADGFEGLTIFKLETSGNLAGQSGENLKNNKPEADIEVSGDEVDYSEPLGIYTFNVNNPVYFSGLGSYDIDGDDISYTWDIEGSNFNEYATTSKDKLSIVFNKAGEYDVSLKVSDGSMEDVKKETVKIVAEDIPVNILKNHEFTVEIITRITNNSAFSLKDLECFTKAPQNYLPFQEIIGFESNSKIRKYCLTMTLIKYCILNLTRLSLERLLQLA